MTMRHIVPTVAVVFALIAIGSRAQGQAYAPAKGQSAEQQSKDTAECQAIAVQQSGFDPAKGTAASPPPVTGERARGAARGAAVGAAAGAIGGDAGKGAAAGAAAGTVAGGVRKRQAGRAQEAAATQSRAAYDKALAACMQGKGYTAH
jgi:YmgG-like glycine-zipper protein